MVGAPVCDRLTAEALGSATNLRTNLRRCGARLPRPRGGGEGRGEGEKPHGHCSTPRFASPGKLSHEPALERRLQAAVAGPGESPRLPPKDGVPVQGFKARIVSGNFHPDSLSFRRGGKRTPKGSLSYAFGSSAPLLQCRGQTRLPRGGSRCRLARSSMPALIRHLGLGPGKAFHLVCNHSPPLL